jgi:hypothetical protein
MNDNYRISDRAPLHGCLLALLSLITMVALVALIWWWLR